MASATASLEFSAIDRLTAPVRRMNAAMERLSAPIKRLGGRLADVGDTTGITKLGGSLSSLGATAGELANRFGIVAAIGGTGLLALGMAGTRAVVGASSQFERFQTILTTIEGSEAKAKASLAWVTDFAQRTPYEVDQVADAFVKLKAYGIDAKNGALEGAGNAAAALGKSVDQAVEALADALTGENERLKEFGIKAEAAGNHITYVWYENGQKMAATADKNNAAAIEATVKGIWDRKYSGAMDRLSHTWGGMWSNLMDYFDAFQRMIGDAGLFDFAKGQLQDLLDLFAQWKADGTLQAVANQISDALVNIGVQIRAFIEGVDWKATWGALVSFGQIISTAADFLGGWDHLAAVLFVVAKWDTITAALSAIGLMGKVFFFAGRVIMSLGAAILASPLLAGITALAGAAYLIYANWAAIGDWFSGASSSVLAGLQGFASTAVDLFAQSNPFAVLFTALNGLVEALGAGLANALVGAMPDWIKALPGTDATQADALGTVPGGEAPAISPAPAFPSLDVPLMAPNATMPTIGGATVPTGRDIALSLQAPPDADERAIAALARQAIEQILERLGQQEVASHYG